MREFSKRVRALLRRGLAAAFRLRARVSPAGQEVLARGGTLLLCNHVSFLDGLLLALASPAPLVAAAEPHYAVHHPLARRAIAVMCWLGGHEVVPIDAQHPQSLRALARHLEAGRNVLLFPEGAISPDGRPLPWQPGWQWLMRRTACTVLRGRIWGAHRSRLFGKKGSEWWPAILFVTAKPQKGPFIGLQRGSARTRTNPESLFTIEVQHGNVQNF